MKNFKLDFVPPHESAFPNVRGSVRIFSLPKQMQTIQIGVALRATTSMARGAVVALVFKERLSR